MTTQSSAHLDSHADCLSVPAAALHFGVHQATVRRWIKEGAAHHTHGGRAFFTPREIDALTHKESH